MFPSHLNRQACSRGQVGYACNLGLADPDSYKQTLTICEVSSQKSEFRVYCLVLHNKFVSRDQVDYADGLADPGTYKDTMRTCEVSGAVFV